MARKKVVTTEEVDDTPATEVDLTGGEGLPSDSELDAIAELLQLGGDDGVKWTVRKIPTKPGERGGYCATYSGGELNADAIRETFGGGKYQIRGTDAQGKYVAARTIEIVDLPRPKEAAPVPVAQGPDMQGLAAIVAALKPDKSGMDLGAVLVSMMQAQAETNKAIFTAMAANRQQGPTLTELLALIKSGDGGGSAIKTLMEGIALGKDLAGGGGGDDMLSLGGKALDVLKPLLEAQAKQPRPATPARVVRSVPVPAARPPDAQPTQPVAAVPTEAEGEDVKQLKQLEWLKLQLGSLVYQANRGRDPELYAAVMLDNLPDYVTEEEVLARIKPDNAVDQLALLDGNVAKLRPWFDAFREACIAILEDDGEDDDEPDDGPPDAAGGGEDLA